MSQTKSNTPALISSRICHDLASPISAIQNGLELLELMGMQQGPELDLLKDSVKSATQRVEFFRLAYGQASADVMISSSEVMRILDGTLGNGRTKVDWDISGDIPRESAKRSFLVLQCLDKVLPLGGDIRITANGDAWQFSAKGKRLADDLTLLNALSSGVPAQNVAPSEVQYLLLQDELLALTCPPAITTSAGEVTVSISMASNGA
jgi:histidine phosphotransferase ChpT